MNLTVKTYNEKCVAVFGATSELENKVMNVKGMFNPRLTKGTEKAAGWIFSKKLEKKSDGAGEKLAKELGWEWAEYSEKSMVAWPAKLEKHTEALVKLDVWKSFNTRLTNPDTTEKEAGWVFSKKDVDSVKAALTAIAS